MSDAPFPGGRRAAVCMTYDDCLPCHRELVAPALSARGLKGTFYCPAAAADLHANVEAWRAVAASGHELGNHSCWHPCRRRDGASWPEATYDLKTYTRKRIVDELLLAERVLRLVDGCERRSFAATCGNLAVGPDGAEESFLEDLRAYTTVVRSGRAGVLPLRKPDLVVGCVSCDAATAATTIAALEPVLAEGGWVVVLAHGVGAGTHGHFVDAGEHERILDWIAEHQDRVWAGTMSEAVGCLQGL